MLPKPPLVSVCVNCVKYFGYQAVPWVGDSEKGLGKIGRRRYGQARVQLPLLFGWSVTLPYPGQFSGTAVFFLGFPVSTAEYAIPQPHNSKRHLCDMTIPQFPWTDSLRSLFRAQMWSSGSPFKVLWSLVHFGFCGLLSDHQPGAAISS